MRSHEIDYRIFGDDLQFVEVELDPGEVVIAEAGAMMYMEQGITFQAKMGDGSDPDQGGWGKLKSAAKRGITGEGLFMTHFTNSAPHGKQRVAMAAPYPGKILPINLAAAGGHLLAQKDAFLCAASGTKLDIAFNRKLGTGVFGGEGFILQSISGDGLAFLHAGGTIVEKQLQGETLRVDTGCIVAFQPQIQYSIERAGDLQARWSSAARACSWRPSPAWAGCGSSPCRSTGIADRVVANLKPGGSQGEGSVIGGLSSMFERK